ncbi:hypothetical protein FACS1894137_17500 [Spirochaetia bacterium]|nr:hypothetical protein FACS1894137_17500 [Spirochaetia bacterium]
MASAKGRKVPTEKKVKDAYLLPDGSMVDLESYDWGNEKLTEKQKLFVVWFCMPTTEYYHHAMKAARKAGYSPKKAHADSYNLRRDPRIEKLIKQFDDSIGKKNIMDAAERYLQEKIIRAEYDINDFYELEEYTDAIGQPKKRLLLKNLDKLTPEQRLCIDGVDMKGQQGIPVFILADRQKERDSIIALAKKSGIDTTDDEFDIETVAELIKGNIQVKTKLIKRNQSIIDKADGFVDAPKHIIEEE